MIGYSLQIAGDAAVGLGDLGLAEAAGDFLLHLAHAQIPLGAVIGEWDIGVPGKKQHGTLVLLQGLPEIVGIGFRDPALFAILHCRDGRQLPLGGG